MHVKIEEKDGVKICYAEGDIDINTSPQIKKVFDKVSQQKSEKVLINLKGVGYIDSSGLATLVEILKNFRNYGVQFFPGAKKSGIAAERDILSFRHDK